MFSCDIFEISKKTYSYRTTPGDSFLNSFLLLIILQRSGCGNSVLKRLWSSHSEVFFRKDVLKICSKFTGEHLCRRVISIKLRSNFIEIALRHGCSPVNLLHVFRTSFPRSTSWWLLLKTIIGYFLSMLCIIHFIILKKSIKTQNINNIVKRFS